MGMTAPEALQSPEAPAQPSGVKCIYADAHLLVLAKPAGLLCVPGRGADKQDCLSTRAQQEWPGALVVHRLDMATSGLVLMARDIATQRALGDAFAQRRVHKRYRAVVHGAVAQPDAGDWGEINLPIAADWQRRPLRVVDAATGKPSLTRWRIVRHDRQTTHLELEPLTGRTHQLRVHLKAIGYPILGDTLYASAAVQALAPRLLLHASEIAFTHPQTQAAMHFALPAPFA